MPWQSETLLGIDIDCLIVSQKDTCTDVSIEIYQLLLLFSIISPWENTTISNTCMVGKTPIFCSKYIGKTLIYLEQNIKNVQKTEMS